MGSILSICISEGKDAAPKELATAQMWRVIGSSGATIRESKELTSAVVSNLEKETTIYVAEVQGRRARLVSPVAGWGSVMTESGYEILQMVVKLKVVSKQGAVMTESAQPDSTVVTTIPYGAVVETKGRPANDRLKVKFDTAEGWISVQAPSKNGSPELIVQQL